MRFTRRSAVALTTLAAAAGLGLSMLQPVAAAAPRDAGNGTTIAERRQAEHALAAVQTELRQARLRTTADVRRQGPDRDLSVKLAALRVRLADLTPADRKAARGYLARPTNGDNLGFTTVKYNDGLAVKNDCGKGKPGQGTNFCVNWVKKSGDAPSLADSNGKRDGDGIPDYIETVRSTMQNVWNTEVKSFGYRAPRNDTKGPNNKLDVYIADIGDAGLYGYCVPEKKKGPGWDYDGYCVLDDDYATNEFPTNNPLKNLQVTAAHEFFHAVQFAYDASEDTWLMEGSAAWIEDEVYDSVNDNLQYLAASPLSNPGRPLDDGDNATYGSWIWWRFLSEEYGRGIVHKIWNRADDAKDPGGEHYSLKAVKAELAARSTTLTKQFGSFAAGNRAVDTTYSEGSSYPNAPAARSHTLNTGGSTGSQTFSIDHLASATAVINRGSGNTLSVVVNVQNSTSSPYARLTSYDASGNPLGSKVIALDGAGDGSDAIAFGAGVDHVDLTLANASSSFNCWTSGSSPYSCLGTPLEENQSFAYAASVS